VDETLRAARLLGRAGRWTEGIQLCESVPSTAAICTELGITGPIRASIDELLGGGAAP